MRQLILPIFILSLACPVLAKAQQTLTIGEPAPAITVSAWLAHTPANPTLAGAPVALEFWATWCGPCVAAIPHLNELEATYAPRGLQFVSLTDEPAEKVMRRLERSPIRGAVATDTSSATQARFGDGERLLQYPMTVLIDASGRVQWVGEPKQLTPKILDAFLDGSLAGKNHFATTASPSVSSEQAAKTPASGMPNAVSPTTTYGNLSTLDSRGFYKLARDAGMLYTLQFGQSKVAPGEGGASSAGEGKLLLKGQTLVELFAAAFGKEVVVPEAIADFSYDLLYLNAGLATGHLAEAEEQVLRALGLRAVPRVELRDFLEVTVGDPAKLPLGVQEPFSSVSEAEGELLLNGWSFAQALANYSERSAVKAFFTGEDSGRYDLTLSTDSAAALVGDLARYGLSAKPVKQEVTVWELK